MSTLNMIINNIAQIYPHPGIRALIKVAFYFVGVFTVVGCITGLISVVNHVKGLIHFG